MRTTPPFPTTVRFLHICLLQPYKGFSPEELRLGGSAVRAIGVGTTEPAGTVEFRSVSSELFL